MTFIYSQYNPSVATCAYLTLDGINTRITHYETDARSVFAVTASNVVVAAAMSSGRATWGGQFNTTDEISSAIFVVFVGLNGAPIRTDTSQIALRTYTSAFFIPIFMASMNPSNVDEILISLRLTPRFSVESGIDCIPSSVNLELLLSGNSIVIIAPRQPDDSYRATLNRALAMSMPLTMDHQYNITARATPDLLDNDSCYEYFPNGNLSPLLPEDGRAITILVTIPTTTSTSSSSMTLVRNGYSGFAFTSVDYDHIPCPTTFISSSTIVLALRYRMTAPSATAISGVPDDEGRLGGSVKITKLNLTCTNQTDQEVYTADCVAYYLSESCMPMRNLLNNDCEFDYLGTLGLNVAVSYDGGQTVDNMGVQPYLPKKTLVGCAAPGNGQVSLDAVTTFDLTAAAGTRGDVVLTLTANNMASDTSITFFIETVLVEYSDNLMRAGSITYNMQEKIEQQSEQSEQSEQSDGGDEDGFFCRYVDEQCFTRPFMLKFLPKAVDNADFSVPGKGYVECEDVISARNVDRFAFKQIAAPGASTINLTAQVTARFTSCGHRRQLGDWGSEVMLRRGVNLTLYRNSIGRYEDEHNWGEKRFWELTFFILLISAAYIAQKKLQQPIVVNYRPL
jgi:hypothetical protein